MTAATTFSISTTDESVSAKSAQFSYDALEPKGRRKSVTAGIRREDVIVRGKREKLQANSADIVRNFSIAAWAVRRHLDYVARFEFRSCTGDEVLDNEINSLIARQSLPMAFDRGHRLSREKGFRLAEARRVLDNETFLVLLNTRQIQGIEADLCRDPAKLTKRESDEWVEGIRIDVAGAPMEYCFHRRESGRSYKETRKIRAADVIHYGFFERYATEQVHGISPLVAALNNFRDVYENIDYALVRSKLTQIFAVALTREAEHGLDLEFPSTSSTGDEEPPEDEPPSKRELDLSNGPTVLDLDPGEKAELLESKTPSNELQAFSRLVLMIALKSLDIPYSFFDEAHTNYSGQRGSWLHYERACMDRRDDQQEMRRRWTAFQLRHAILDGELTLPSGMDVEQISYKWIPKGMPWWKPSEELTADLKAIAAGLTNPQEVAAKNGLGDVKEHIRELAQILKFAREHGTEVLGEPIRLNFDPGPFASAVTDQVNQPDA